MNAELHSSLEEVVRTLRAAFPGGLSKDDLDPLMIVLWEGLSDRNLGLVVEKFAGVDRDEVSQLASVAINNRAEHRTRTAEIEKLLAQHGWDSEDD